jgi:RimJ/RimL family protein N-acetyltransferase
MEHNEQYLFSNKIVINSIQDFESWFINNIHGYYHDFYIAECSNAVVGFAYTYEFRPFDLNCKICVYIKSEFQTTGMGGIVAITFINELFTGYPLKKVYAPIFGYNKQSLMSNLQAGFVEEGVLKEYRYHNGFFYDLHLLSMYRETFYDRWKQFISDKEIIKI